MYELLPDSLLDVKISGCCFQINKYFINEYLLQILRYKPYINLMSKDSLSS